MTTSDGDEESTKMTCYGYFRLSEADQAGSAERGKAGKDGKDSHVESRASLSQDQLAVESYCEQRGWYKVESLRDPNVRWGESFVERPVAVQLMEKLEPGDVIVVASIERIFSSCQDAVQTIAALKSRQVELHCVALGGDVTDSGFTVNFAGLVKAFAELERRRSAEKVRDVKRNQRQKGRYLGGNRPFGYMIHDNGRLLENPMEQRVLKKILSLKKQGKSLRYIAEAVSTPMAPVSFKTVQRLLQRHSE